ncbi:MAG: Rieske (2Fe-2S) protein [Candidatus Kapabacteria bacterium]|nr:Rieske (2Fe-2S) protein [Candidatus Kapabacteria bacterium]
MENNQSLEQRRDFIKKSLGLAGLVLCAGSMSTLLESCNSSSFNPNPTGNVSLDITTVPELAVNGGVVEKTFAGQFNGTPVIIIKVTETSYLAFCTICPHEGQIVSYPLDSTSNIVCQAHKSYFSPTTGEIIKGPSPSGLKKYTTLYDAATRILTITG